tara:strand:- start:5908 stop:7158 length:1251 start_codon:yes stop_codon:yes gene_type:complete
MNLRDMLDSISEENFSEFAPNDPAGPDVPKAPSSQHRKIDREITGRSVDQTEVSMDKLKNSKNPAIQDLFKKAELLNKLLDNQATAQIVATAIKKIQMAEPKPQAESIDLDEFAGPEADASTVKGEIPINVLSNVMGDDTDVNLMRQALRQIQNERGINKRFMPALKTFMAPYVSILKSGFTGYNQIVALQKALNKGEPAVQDQQPQQDLTPDQIPEPSEEEILTYGNEVQMPTVTDKQKQEVADMLKKAQAGTLGKDSEKEPNKEKVAMAASKYSEGVDELKRLAQMVEAMSDAYGEDQMVAPVELNPDSPEQVEGSVEFKQHKNTDKGSVSVEASGETMQDLADVLKLAGLTLPQDMHKDEPEAHDEPEAEMPCDSEEPEDDKVMVVSPKDASYSTDKQVLVNYLKDKLKKSIS